MLQHMTKYYILLILLHIAHRNDIIKSADREKGHGNKSGDVHLYSPLTARRIGNNDAACGKVKNSTV